MRAWSQNEVELIVADYFSMLTKELSRQPYNKAEHRRNLLPLLDGRSEGSIEFKHQNISAVLIWLGLPYIKGYLPRFNYQNLLEDVVVAYLIDHQNIETQFNQFADRQVHPHPIRNNYDRVLVEPPLPTRDIREPAGAYTRNPIRINYLEKEQRNSQLGWLGEEFVLEYERWQLSVSGKEHLADQVRWISIEEGDGAGFDILSKYENGRDKYIEVKTTKLGKETPFFFSRNELLFSQHQARGYHLYRLFDFEDNARMFVRNGGLDAICQSVPMTFIGYF